MSFGGTVDDVVRVMEEGQMRYRVYVPGDLAC